MCIINLNTYPTLLSINLIYLKNSKLLSFVNKKSEIFINIFHLLLRIFTRNWKTIHL